MRGASRVVGAREQFDASRRQPCIHADPPTHLPDAAAASGAAQPITGGSD